MGPEKAFRMGLVSASVFVNEYEVNDGKRGKATGIFAVVQAAWGETTGTLVVAKWWMAA